MRLPLAALVALSSLVGGCGHQSARFVGKADDGADVYGVSCKDRASKCVSEALGKCGKIGYEVVESDSHSGGLVSDETPGPSKWYWLAFKCGGPSSTPDFPWRGPKPTTNPGVTDEPTAG